MQGIDLEVAEGEIYGFLGPNGAGKTTTVRMLTTLLLPTGGRATVAGHDVVKEAREVRRAIGVALQESALDPLMTGRELIRLQATLQGIPTAEGRERADALIERVGLTDAADRRVGELLRRHAAPARPRRRARPRAPRPLPRRADHRPGPGQPQDDLGGGAGAERRRHDGLPHHAVPRGGRPARRQRRDHRRAAGSSPRARPRRSNPRSATPTSACSSRRARSPRPSAPAPRSASCFPRSTARPSWSRSPGAPPTSRGSCGRSTRRGSGSARSNWSTPPSTTSSSPPPGHHLEEDGEGSEQEAVEA